MTDTLFDTRQLDRLRAFADALIPAAPGHSSASEAGIPGPLLDRLVMLVPERIPLLKRVVDSSPELSAQAVIDAMQRDDPALYDAFCQTIAGAYFMSPQVRVQIDYPGREPVAARADIADMEELLMPVFTGDFAPRPVPD
jgi:hypothetical protein